MLLDTSGLLNLHHAAEPFHDQAVAAFDSAPRRLTNNYVLAEVVALAQARGLPRLPVLEFLGDLVASPEIETVWVDRELHELVMRLLRDRPDKSYSLCDAVSFILMSDRGIHDALTTDRHFEQEGFHRLLV
jgi:predicted nucleic acid-binding protein